MSIEAMKQAREVIELGDDASLAQRYAVLTNIDQAIAEAEKQEPVAWNTGVPPMWPQQKGGETFIVSYEDPQPKREWVGLTLEEIWDSTHGLTRIQKDDWVATDADLIEFVHIIEDRLKAKNR